MIATTSLTVPVDAPASVTTDARETLAAPSVDPHANAEHDPDGVYPLCCRYHAVNSRKVSQQSLLKYFSDAAAAGPIAGDQE
ncbi:hypothetical protein HDU83_004267 [Entophlyctis luteolus]|nr:hypothetical protein HDU83_004267 [Entophlyctis luteolus]